MQSRERLGECRPLRCTVACVKLRLFHPVRRSPFFPSEFAPCPTICRNLSALDEPIAKPSPTATCFRIALQACRTGVIHVTAVTGGYLACFFRFAHRAFIRSDWSLARSRGQSPPAAPLLPRHATVPQNAQTLTPSAEMDDYSHMVQSKQRSGKRPKATN
jgi:hypothetical protein